jgi:Glycosyltransferase WbsX
VTMITRRALLSSGAAFGIDSCVLPAWSRTGSGCVFGAIRWDAQYCNSPGEPCFEEEKALGVQKWQFRAPLHSEIEGPNQIRFSPTQATFDKEIAAAKRGGLRYWAYLMYGNDGVINLNHSMMRGLVFHRSSSIKAHMNYAMMVSVDTLGHAGDYTDAVDMIVELMRDGNYQKVLDGRPVLFIYYIDSLLRLYWKNSITNMAESISWLRISVKQAGLGNPYIIVMNAPPASAESVRAGLGADAICAYAITLPSITQGTPYAELARFTRSYWDKELAATSADVVPTVMIGWDTRPRKEHPPAYDHSDRSHVDLATYVTAPSPAEFAAECKSARDFIHAHRGHCAAQLALIYAWNEDSEGGPLEPTLGDPTASLLTAASGVIK